MQRWLFEVLLFLAMRHCSDHLENLRFFLCRKALICRRNECFGQHIFLHQYLSPKASLIVNNVSIFSVALCVCRKPMQRAAFIWERLLTMCYPGRSTSWIKLAFSQRSTHSVRLYWRLWDSVKIAFLSTTSYVDWLWLSAKQVRSSLHRKKWGSLNGLNSVLQQ